ncbi:MAG: hypothetical protein ACK4NA_15425 [Alphaproteobacteria bacterium]
MTVRRRLFVALPLLAVLSLAAVAASVSPARADTHSVAPTAEEPRRPGQIARERVDEALRSLEKFVADLPRYGLPQIAENGDIVIPRKNPPTRGGEPDKGDQVEI